MTQQDTNRHIQKTTKRNHDSLKRCMCMCVSVSVVCGGDTLHSIDKQYKYHVSSNSIFASCILMVALWQKHHINFNYENGYLNGRCSSAI